MENARDSRELFRLVEQAKQEWEKAMDCVGDVVILLDSQQRIKRCNKALADLAGRKYRELLGHDCWELFESLGMAEGDSAGADLELHHQVSGRVFHLSHYPLHFEAAGFSGQVVTLHDITLRKRMAVELEEKNREMDKNRRDLQRALDELSLMIRRVTEKGEFDLGFDLPPNLGQCWKVMQCNQQGCPCYGREPMRCWQIAGTHCKGEVQGGFAQKIGACERCKFYQEATRDPIYLISEEFNHMMFILAEKNRELNTAYEDLKASQAKLLQQEKMASIGQLAAGVAHEINNPMGFVTSNLGSLAKYLKRLEEFLARQSEFVGQCADPAQATELGRLRKELKIDFIMADSAALIQESLDGADRVRTIVQNLKSFSRVDQAQENLADINQCLEDTINIIWNELKYKCEVKKEYGELPPTRCFPQQLNQVFMNLLMNAAQAIAEKGTITIRTWAGRDEIRVAISDTGCGIAPEHLNRLFEPFFTTKEVGKGTGLGLAISYDIIKKHGGRIEVASAPGEGTTFTVGLPVRD